MKNLLLSLLLASPGSIAVSAPLELQARSASAPDILWTDGILALQKPRSGPSPKLGYAVFKARPSLKLDTFLPKGSTRTPLAQSLDLNYYVAPIDSQQTLQELARLAHDSTGMCGSLELIPLTSSIQSTVTIYPPIYGSRMALDEAKTLIEEVSLGAMDVTIDTLAALPSRFYNHAQGQNAHTTVRQIWEGLITNNRWTITEETQSLSNQKSIVARLEGQSKADETIIIGAHLDSIVSRSGNSTLDNAPGADDDASGIAVLTDILRVIEAHQLTFDRSIEIQAYAAEEVGLVGSRAIATRYAEAGKKIAGMFQIDMAYYSVAGGSGIIHLLQDYTSRDLRRQTIDWIRTYIGPFYELGFLPRGSASDHKSFYDKGFPTVFPFEDPAHYNPYIHSYDDTRAHFDDGLLLRRITQLALLFTFHQGGLTTMATAYDALKKDQLPEDLRQGLKLAIQQTGDQYYFAVSTPLAATTLEFCRIDAGSSLHCSQEREALDKTVSGSARKVFYSTGTLGFAADQNWRVLAYDAKDELIAFRQFTLKVHP